MVDATDAGLIGCRDRAVLLLGFAGAFRRSEIVGLDSADCIFSKNGLTVTLGRSKTDQEGTGRKIGIPHGSNPDSCPVRVLQSWIEQSNHYGRAGIPVAESPRAGSAVPTIRNRRGAHYEEASRTAGLDPSRYAGHSLRAGHATVATIAGASERSIMNQTGHRTVQMVRRYIRDANLFRENSAAKLGL